MNLYQLMLVRMLLHYTANADEINEFFFFANLQLVILVKYVFQFSCFGWLKTESQGPLWIPQLVGIERRDMYAAYDFFLLFCLFLHRMVLKVRLCLFSELSTLRDNLFSLCKLFSLAEMRALNIFPLTDNASKA